MAHFVGMTEDGPVMAVILPYHGNCVLVGNGTILSRGPAASLVRIGTQLGFEVVDCTTTNPEARQFSEPGELFW